MSDRFVVVSVSGYPVTPHAQALGTNHVPSTSWSVLDSVYCYREVDRFYAGQFTRSPANERKARAKAAELNAWDAREGTA